MLKQLSSLKLTVFCLFFLAVLTFLGTIYQVEHGLYAAQQKFFDGWFLFYGFLPLPSAQTLMIILAINLIAAIFNQLKPQPKIWRKKIGLYIAHFGLVLLLVSGFYTLHFSNESYLELIETERSNQSADYYKWQLDLLDADSLQKQSIDLDDLLKEKNIKTDLGFELLLKTYMPNSKIFQTPFAGKIMKEMPLSKEAETNFPGLNLVFKAKSEKDLQLHGAQKPTVILTQGDKEIQITLQRKKYPLPIFVELEDVRRELYPGTQIAKSYESTVKIGEPSGLNRIVKISMNKPLRFKNYTFYQANYGINMGGEEYSVLAVVKNANWLLPYIAALLMSLGLFLHFLLRFVDFLKTRKELLVVLFLLLGFSLPARAANDFSLEEFKRIVVLDQGRYKPLDSFARSLLLQFSGRETVDGSSAMEWLTETIFQQNDFAKKKIFLINNPELLEAYGLETDHKRRYSFDQLRIASEKITDFAFEASQINEKDQGPLDKEFLRVFKNLHTYIQLLESMQPLMPDSDFHSETENKDLSLFQVLNRIDDLEESLEQLPNMAVMGLKNVPVELKEKFEMALNLYKWLEGKKNYMEIFAQKQQLRLVFNNETKSAKAFSVWEAVQKSELRDNPLVHQQLAELQSLVAAFQAKDQGRFDSLANKIAERFAYKTKVELEISNNVIKPFFYAKLLYGFAFLFLLIGSFFATGLLTKVSTALNVCAFTLHSFGILSRILILERAPVSNLYETFIFVSWVTVLLGLGMTMIAKWKKDAVDFVYLGSLLAAFSGLALLLISGKFAAEGDTMQVLIAVLNSNFWLSTHVICVTVGYAGVAAAGLLAHVYLLRDLFKKETGLTQLSKTILGILGFGLCFSFLGTMLGGIWADQSWGRFWGWDPKENGALLIVLWSAVVFHARLAGMVKERGVVLLTALGTVVVMLSWFGVNLLGVGLHSYGFTSGLATGFYAYLLLELVFVVIYLTIMSLRSRANSQ